MYSSSSIYRLATKTVFSKRRTGHSPAVRAARRNGPVLILKGPAAILNAGIYARS